MRGTSNRKVSSTRTERSAFVKCKETRPTLMAETYSRSLVRSIRCADIVLARNVEHGHLEEFFFGITDHVAKGLVDVLEVTARLYTRHAREGITGRKFSGLVCGGKTALARRMPKEMP